MCDTRATATPPSRNYCSSAAGRAPEVQGAALLQPQVEAPGSADGGTFRGKPPPAREQLRCVKLRQRLKLSRGMESELPACLQRYLQFLYASRLAVPAGGTPARSLYGHSGFCSAGHLCGAGVRPTQLFPRNAEVDRVNKAEMAVRLNSASMLM